MQTKYILSKPTTLKVQIKLPQSNKQIGAVLSAHVTNTIFLLMGLGRIWHFTSTEHRKLWKRWIPLIAAISLYYFWQSVHLDTCSVFTFCCFCYPTPALQCLSLKLQDYSFVQLLVGFYEQVWNREKKVKDDICVVFFDLLIIWILLIINVIGLFSHFPTAFNLKRRDKRGYFSNFLLFCWAEPILTCKTYFNYFPLTAQQLCQKFLY